MPTLFEGFVAPHIALKMSFLFIFGRLIHSQHTFYGPADSYNDIAAYQGFLYLMVAYCYQASLAPLWLISGPKFMCEIGGYIISARRVPLENFSDQPSPDAYEDLLARATAAYSTPLSAGRVALAGFAALAGNHPYMVVGKLIYHGVMQCSGQGGMLALEAFHGGQPGWQKAQLVRGVSVIRTLFWLQTFLPSMLALFCRKEGVLVCYGLRIITLLAIVDLAPRVRPRRHQD